MADLIERPSPEYLRSLLSYDAETGLLFWRSRENAAPGWNNRYAGKETFTTTDMDGYRQGKVNNRNYRAHTVAWAIYYGEWPEPFVDHIDGDRGNNKIANLRLADKAQNCQNAKIRRDNRSGLKGVSWNARRSRWHAQIAANGKSRTIGYFKDAETAYAAYCAAATELHGKFARTR